ncbi:MAG TPA: hypothetical protein DEF47_00330 [Herpetosiphon sp.]|uniref:Uncharacterized protein n=1 Tax=Herpetosiphon aurantiacus (strain ATCC 23779 / DSM 785 / 114-95) TaxID=316274 RepID=A9B4J5_HERA2|nr:hypothetical protein [Herpetosiphon sp.]ABX04160.1 hypothetical protein Haur_1516 [Herpetosiphon aurantiacus DSM 785]HBW48335.1 hypothetical protein [Herpetosiphon sp.]
MQTPSKLAYIPLFNLVKWWQALNMLVVGSDRLGAAIVEEYRATATHDFLRYLQHSGLISELRHSCADLRFFIGQQLPTGLEKPNPDYHDLLELLSTELGYFWNEHPPQAPRPNHATLPLYKLWQWWHTLTMIVAAFEQLPDQTEASDQTLNEQGLIDYLTQTGLFLACGQIRYDLNIVLAQHDLSFSNPYELDHAGLFGQIAVRLGYAWQAPQ